MKVSAGQVTSPTASAQMEVEGAVSGSRVEAAGTPHLGNAVAALRIAGMGAPAGAGWFE